MFRHPGVSQGGEPPVKTINGYLPDAPELPDEEEPVSPELLLPGELLPPEDELPAPPGVSAAPVAEPPLDRPKYEKMLCRQPG